MRELFNKKVSNLFFLIFLIPALLSISNYNVNWDEAEHFRRGHAILNYFLTGQTNYDNLPSYNTHQSNLFEEKKTSRSIFPRYSFYQNRILNGDHYLFKDNGGHPPLGGIIAALSNYVFFQKIGILGDVEAHHFAIIISVAILVFFASRWVYKEYGIFASFITVLSMSLYPLLFAESHVNIKDPIETLFYTLTIYTFYFGITKNKEKYILLSSVFCGMAFATKFNILFLPFIIIPWLVVFYNKHILKLKRFLPLLILFPFIVFGIFFACWPFLWFEFPQRILNVFGYYKGMGISLANPDYFYILGFNTYPLQTILYTTPIIILFFSICGVLYVFLKGFREKNKTSFLVFIWFIIPIIRVTLPNTSIYGGVRQIMEYIPAMAILCGIGAKYFVSILNNYVISKFKITKIFIFKPLLVFQVVCILSFIPITLKLISIHPNENVYFNPLIGGLKGAKEKSYPYWGLNLGSSYKKGIDWINKNVEKNAKVALLLGTAENIPRISFREDIIFDNGAWSATERKGEYLIEAVFDGWIREWHYAGEYVDQVLKPVYEVKIDGVAILKVWKNDAEHTDPKYLKEFNVNSEDVKWAQDKNTLYIKMKNPVELVRVSVYAQNKECFDFKYGEFSFSSDGNTWFLEKEPIRSMYRSENKLEYPLVAKKLKYIKMEIGKTSCPFKIKDVNISYINS